MAEVSGLSRRTVYNHFATKEELYVASRTQLLGSIAAELSLDIPNRALPAVALEQFCERSLLVLAGPAHSEISGSLVRDRNEFPWIIGEYDRLVVKPLTASIELFLLRRHRGAGDTRASARELAGILIALSAYPQQDGAQAISAPLFQALIGTLVRTCLEPAERSRHDAGWIGIEDRGPTSSRYDDSGPRHVAVAEAADS